MAITNEMLIKTVKTSALLGAGLVIAALIPAFMPFIALFVLPFLAGPCVLIYLKIVKTVENIELRDYATLGGIIGIVSGFVFLILFCPIVSIIHLIFKNYYAYGINFLNPFLAIVLFLSIACIFAVSNVAMTLVHGFLVKSFFKE